MQAIETSDACCICMDEANRDFLYKTCCKLLVCRKCYNQLEVESFPSNSICPGCRQTFHKVGYSVDVIENVAVPRAYCGLALPNISTLKEHDAHVLNCVECLKRVIKGNSWFEKQLTEKFSGMKRKLETLEDEVYVRNQRIRELTYQNALLAQSFGRVSRRSTEEERVTTSDTPLTVSSTELIGSSSSEEEPVPPLQTPPRITRSAAAAAAASSLAEEDTPRTPPVQEDTSSRTTPPILRRRVRPTQVSATPSTRARRILEIRF